MGTNKRKLGAFYEEKAAAFLQEQGLEICRRNFRCRAGEIDLVARDGSYLVFVEVKYRKKGESGSSLEAVDKKKQRTICFVAQFYLFRIERDCEIPCRFDVVGIDGEEIRWIRNAFDYCT